MRTSKKPINLETALIYGQVPKKKYSHLEEFVPEQLEQAVSSPQYAPLPGAETFDVYGTVVFRISDAEELLTKSDLNRLGVKSTVIAQKEPYTILKPKKGFGQEMYRPSDFANEIDIAQENNPKNKKQNKEKSSFDRKRTIPIKQRNGFNIFLNYPNDDDLVPVIDFNTKTSLTFKRQSFIITAIINRPLETKKARADMDDYEHVMDCMGDFILPAAKALDEIHDTVINKYCKRLGYVHTIKFNVSQEDGLLDQDLVQKEFKEKVLDMFDGLIAREDQKSTLASLLSSKPYHEHFPARKASRKIIIYEAPTNAGKTYNACNIVKELINADENAKAVCVFPLRALAAQIKDEFMEDGYPCSLVTGEEREIEQDARIESITAEIMSVAKQYDLAFVDESQLLFDKSRGAAYARAIIGAYSKTLILAVAPAYKNALKYWLETVVPDDEIEERELTRLCPLFLVDKDITPATVEKGDIIVAFSAKEIHRIAASLAHNFKVGVIYGKMSPSARRAMVRNFMEDGFDVLIATDAIGMGISIPAKRVLFSALEKYDGDERRVLSKEEIRQIAGRAGRYGFYDEGFYGTYMMPNNDFYIKKAVEVINPEPIPNKLTISPDKHIFMSAAELSLMETIKVWERAVKNDYYAVNEPVMIDLSKKAYFLDFKRDVAEKEVLVGLLFVTFAEDKYAIYESSVLELLDGSGMSDYVYKGKIGSVEYFEDYAQWLTLASQLQRIFPDQCMSETDIMAQMDECGEGMTELLTGMYAE